MAEYNITKYNILCAIQECNEQNIPATSIFVSSITGLKENNASSRMTRFYQQGYLTRSAYEENKCFCGYKYKLSKKGKSVLEKFGERFVEGYDLNIRKKPKPFDWSKVQLLPGLHMLQELKNESK